MVAEMINGTSDGMNLSINIKTEPMDDVEALNNSENGTGGSPEWTMQENVSPSNIISEYKRKKMEEQIKTHIGEKRRRIMSEESQGSSSEYNGDDNTTDDTSVDQASIGTDNKCYICDIVFVSQEELVIHMTVKHKRKNNARRQIGRFARHTCQVCFARFRTLKDFFNHTSCHSGQSDVNTVEEDIGARISRNINKNALQHLILENSSLERNLLQPTFKCDKCHTVFVNRDSYAMHVMMSVKNQNCKPTCGVLNIDVPRDIHQKDNEQIQTDTTENTSERISAGSNLQLAYYEDVTSKTDKDEYLQQFLEKSNLKAEQSKKDLIKSITMAGKSCFFCDEKFLDKDSLAMHVMSHHSNNVMRKPQKEDNMAASPLPVPQLVQYFTTYPGNELLAVRTDVFKCEFCERTFTNRDALAMHVLSHNQEHENKLRYNKRKPLHTVKFDLHPNKSSPTYIEAWKRNQISKPEDLLGISMTYEDSRKDEPLNLVANKVDIRSLYDQVQQRSPPSKHDVQLLEYYKYDDKLQENEATNKRPDNDLEKPLNLTKESENASASSKSERLSKFRARCSSLPDLSSAIGKSSPERCSSTGALESNMDISIKGSSFYQDNVQPDEKVFSYVFNSTSYTENITQNENTSLEKETTDSYMDKYFKICGGNDEDGKQAIDTLRTESIKEEPNPMKELLIKNPQLNICKFCDIIFPSKTLYYLHVGLHNVNNPWQCNMCGKVCNNVNDFSAHVIHFG